MPAEIQPTDTKINYVSIAEAKKMSGLRLISGAYADPAPWREACKSLFYVKGIPYTAVVTSNKGTPDLQIGMNNSQSELIAWTGQASSPVAIWNDELPVSKWVDQLNLAERLEPEPRLIPLCGALTGSSWRLRPVCCARPESFCSFLHHDLHVRHSAHAKGRAPARPRRPRAGEWQNCGAAMPVRVGG